MCQRNMKRVHASSQKESDLLARCSHFYFCIARSTLWWGSRVVIKVDISTLSLLNIGHSGFSPPLFLSLFLAYLSQTKMPEKPPINIYVCRYAKVSIYSLRMRNQEFSLQSKNPPPPLSDTLDYARAISPTTTTINYRRQIVVIKTFLMIHITDATPILYTSMEVQFPPSSSLRRVEES